MLFEIIKHAAHATVDYHGVEKAKDHPIRVTVVYGSKDLAVRVSDEGALFPTVPSLDVERLTMCDSQAEDFYPGEDSIRFQKPATRLI